MSILRKLCLLLLCAAWPAFAVIETYEFSSEELELRYQSLSAELRCPKCQNQNIADSNAPIAQDLRKTLYKQLEQGASDEEILEYMVARYGEFVRYRPRFGGLTSLLWLFPLLLLVAGVFVLVANLRRGRTETAGESGAAITAEQQASIDSLLQDRERRS